MYVLQLPNRLIQGIDVEFFHSKQSEKSPVTTKLHLQGQFSGDRTGGESTKFAQLNLSNINGTLRTTSVAGHLSSDVERLLTSDIERLRKMSSRLSSTEGLFMVIL